MVYVHDTRSHLCSHFRIEGKVMSCGISGDEQSIRVIAIENL